MSLIGALPLVKEARGRKVWLLSMVVYGAAGLMSSALVGFTLGAVGSISTSPSLSAGLVLAVCAYVVLRESRLVALPLLQARRQTSEMWGKALHPLLAAALWGADLGLVFTTYLTFAGPWLVAALAMSQRNVPFGVLLFSSFWIGRVLTQWLSAVALYRGGYTLAAVTDEIVGSRRLFRHLHTAVAVGIGLAVITLTPDAFRWQTAVLAGWSGS